jgi:ubiquinone/menaquinone biosynthesis C-methylase UbiE
MNLTENDVAALSGFLERIKSQTYPENPTELHSDITAQMLERLCTAYALGPGTRVLDVGCGQGVAMRLFVERKFEPVGIALNDTDVQACVAQGYDVRQMDQSFLQFPDASFDLLWCRHCLEHSVFPYFTLDGFHRVLKPGGLLYVEVPAPDTSCQHQTNLNHYSVLGKSMWVCLLQRAGFEVKEMLDINFSVVAGPDTYWVFVATKPLEASVSSVKIC